MDDTHTAPYSDDADPTTEGRPLGESPPPAEALAALDPADAPDVAEALAAELAEDLEAAGAPPPEPTQLAVDIEGLSDTGAQ